MPQHVNYSRISVMTIPHSIYLNIVAMNRVKLHQFPAIIRLVVTCSGSATHAFWFRLNMPDHFTAHYQLMTASCGCGLHGGHDCSENEANAVFNGSTD